MVIKNEQNDWKAQTNLAIGLLAKKSINPVVVCKLIDKNKELINLFCLYSSSGILLLTK